MKINKIIASLTFLVLMAVSCATNPFTGKKTLALIPNSQLFPTSFAQYNQVLSEGKVVTGTQQSEMIKRVGQRIAVAAERWLNANGKPGYLNDYKWEYNLIQEAATHAVDIIGLWSLKYGDLGYITYYLYPWI